MSGHTVAICSRRPETSLSASLLELSAEVPRDAEVLIVLSGVDPSSLDPGLNPEWRNRLACPLQVVYEPRLGAARARARALAESGSDVVVFIDDDVRVSPGWFRAMAEAMRRPEVGAAGGTILPLWPGDDKPPWIPAGLLSYFGERIAGPDAEHRPFAANMAVRRSAATEAGGFELALGHVGAVPGLHEEVDLVDRIEQAGYAIAEVPRAIVHHIVRREQLHLSWVLRRAWHEGRSDFIRDRKRSDTDVVVRLLKAVALIAGLLPSLARRTWFVYVSARVLVNASYLWQASRASVRRPDD